MGIFGSFKARIDQNHTHKECSLLCVALIIRLSAHNNHLNGIYDGCVSYGEGIVVPQENAVTKKVLVSVG